MTIDNFANWAFAYVLVGAVIWALLFASGAMDKARAYSMPVTVMVSAGAIFGWPALVVVFFAGMAQARRGRRASR